MAIDSKYGRVTLEHGTIGEDEPVVVFRAKDRLLVPLLGIYAQLCDLAGSPGHHLSLIYKTREKVDDWQDENPPRTPNSDAYLARVMSSKADISAPWDDAVEPY